MPLANQRPQSTNRPLSGGGREATFAPPEPERRAKPPTPIMPQPCRDMQGDPDDEIEAALLREFLFSRSVASLATSLAARVDDGTSPEEFIAAAGCAARA